MKIQVLGFALTTQDRVLIEKILKAYKYDLNEVEIIDVRAYSVDMSNSFLALCFGEKAFRNPEIQQSLHQPDHISIELPPIQKLYPPQEGGDAEARTTVHTILTKLNETLTHSVGAAISDTAILQSVDTKSLPDLSVGTIQALEKKLTELGRTSWHCITESGAVVRVSTKQQEHRPPEVVVDITFAELVAMRLAMDVLGTKEITLSLDAHQSQTHTTS